MTRTLGRDLSGKPHTHTATIGRNLLVPVRRDGAHWVSKYECNLGIYHAARDLRDLKAV